MSPALSQAGQVSGYAGPSFVQGYGSSSRAGPSSQQQTPGAGPSGFEGYGVLSSAPGYTLPSPIAPPSLGPYGGSLSAPGPSDEDQRRQGHYEDEQRQFKEEPHGY